MPTINEYKKRALTALGYTGSINDAEYKWLRSVCAPYKGSIPDMWKYYLTAQGYTTGSLVDRQMKYLAGLGHTGTINQRWYKYWSQGVGVTYEAEATALFARMSVQPDAARKADINAGILTLKTAGVWAKLDALYVLAAHDAQAARLNWIAANYDLTAVASPTFVTDLGYTGNGSTSYLDTGFNPTTAPSPKFTLNNGCMFSWVAVDVNEDRSEIGNTNSQVGGRRGATLNLRARMNAASTNNGCAVSDGLGLSAWSRIDANNVSYYKNGVNGLNEVRAASALSNDNITLLSAAGSAAFASTKTVALGGFGARLTDAEQAALYAAFA